MGKSIEDWHLIDRFLHGELSGIEKENFNKRVNTDDAFRSDVELSKDIYSGIQIANQNRLEGIILASLKYRKPAIPFALKMIVTFLIITGGGITLWFYVGNESASKDQSKSWFAFLKSRKADEKSKVEISERKTEYRTKNIKGQASVPIEEGASVNAADSSRDVVLVGDVDADSLQAPDVEEEIIVKQDQMVTGTSIAVEVKGDEGGGNNDDQLTKEAISKLNPAADLPEDETSPVSYEVEFWISPVNYRGYKMSKNKLILFGIDEPEAVKLYRVNNELYMSYLKDHYRLQASLDFMSYQKLKDSEIPLAIK